LGNATMVYPCACGFFVNVRIAIGTFLASLLGTHELSKDVKECRPPFLASLLGYKPSDDVKKCQQTTDVGMGLFAGRCMENWYMDGMCVGVTARGECAAEQGKPAVRIISEPGVVSRSSSRSGRMSYSWRRRLAHSLRCVRRNSAKELDLTSPAGGAAPRRSSDLLLQPKARPRRGVRTRSSGRRCGPAEELGLTAALGGGVHRVRPPLASSFAHGSRAPPP
jgi:hypothetical protein